MVATGVGFITAVDISVDIIPRVHNTLDNTSADKHMTLDTMALAWLPS